MKLQIGESAAAPAMCAAIVARVFSGLMVETPALHNGAWLSVLIGAALSLPLLWCMDLTRRQACAECPGVARVPGALIAVVLLAELADCAAVIRGIADSAAYLALDHVDASLLIAPICLAALWCVSRNGDAIGYSAQIWIKVFPALILIVLLLQLPRYRYEWLTPILGNGWASILDGALRTAGWIAATSSALLLARKEPGEKGVGPRPVKTLAVAVPVVVGLIALRLMMTPTPVSGNSFSRLNRLDSLLTNGRGPLYLQLPMIVLWTIGMLHLCAFDAFVTAALLQRFVPALNGLLCGAMVIAVAALLAHSAYYTAIWGSSGWFFVAISVAAAIALVSALTGKGGKHACVSRK